MIMWQPQGSMIPFAILGGIAWLAIVAGVVLLVIWAIRAFPMDRFVHAAPAGLESPLDTLARRFARGEITAEEFKRARDLLRGDPPKP
jgi:putative membrane protein